MADETTKINNIKDLQEQLSALENLAKKSEITATEYNSRLEAIKKSSGNLTGAAVIIENAGKKIKEFFDKIKNLDASALVEQFESFGVAFKEIGPSVTNFVGAYVGLTRLPQPDQLFKGFSNASETLNDLSKSAGNVNDVLRKLGVPEALTDAITTVAQGEQRFNTLAQGMYSTAAASGNLSEFLEDVSTSAGKIDTGKLIGKMEKLESISYSVAKSTNANLSSVREFASTLESNVPGALDEANNFIMESGEQLNALEGTMRVAAGAGIKTADAITYVGMAFEDFNLKPQEAAENLASMAATADSLGMKSKFMTSYVNETANTFKYFTDNTQALIRVMGNLAPAFQAAKLSPQAITELTTKMVQNIQQMGLAQRSFLSMQTGGPGGLRGGYEIELLKAQGKFDEIQKKTDQALRKQFGGRVVTLEEASRDEGAARQLAKQVQLVTSGPTKVVDTEAQAYKLFEAMRSGAAGGKAITGADALESTMKKGEGIQELQTSILTDISNDIEHVAFNTNIMAKQASGDVGKLVRGAVETFSKKAKIDEKTGKETGEMEETRAASSLKKYGLDFLGIFGEDEAKERRTRARQEASTMSYSGPAMPKDSLINLAFDEISDLISPKTTINEAAQSEEGAIAYARQQASFELPPRISVPLQGRKGSAPAEDIMRTLEEMNSIRIPQNKEKAPGGEQNQHTVTIVLQSPDGRELEKTILNIVNGESSLDRQASTIGARTQRNP